MLAKRLGLFFICLLFISTLGSSQTTTPCQRAESATVEVIDSLIYQALNHRAQMEEKLSAIASSIICFGKAHKDEERLSNGYFILGSHYYFEAKLDSALHYLYYSHNLAQKNGYQRIIALSGNFLSLSYSEIGQHHLALDYQQSYLDYGLAVNNLYIQREAYINMASLYENVGQHEKSLDYNLKALEYFKAEQSGNYSKENYLWLHIALAKNYFTANRNTDAESYYKQAIKISEEINFLRGRFWAYIGACDFYLKTDITKARLQLENLSELLKEFGNEHFQTEYLYRSAVLDQISGNYSSAIEKLESAIPLAQKNKYVGLEQNILNRLVDLYGSLQLKDKEVSTLKMLRQRLNQRANDVNVKSMEIWVKNQKILSNQKQENERLKSIGDKHSRTLRTQRIVILAVLFSFMAMGFYYYNSWTMNRLSKKQNEILKNKNENIANQLALISQQKEQLENAQITIKEERGRLRKELNQKMIYIANEKEMLSNITELIESTELAITEKNAIKKHIERHNRETIWDEYDQQLAETNKTFFAKLAQKEPKLTTNDFRLAAMIKMNLENKEISRLLSRSIESIHMAKSRLRKKLKLETGSASLVSYFNAIMENLEEE